MTKQETEKLIERDRIATDSDYRADMRHRFETDHFFAARILGFNDFTERAHGPVFHRFYFPKNRNLPIEQQSSKHKRIHLDPRRTFKTTAKRVDRIQTLAAFSEEVTILVESATQPLAEQIAKISARPFWSRSGEPTTDFHFLYPELITTKEPDGVWDSVNRRSTGAGDLDHTIAFTSPKSTQSGWHPMVMEPDDVEDTNNSGIGVNQEVRQKVIDSCDQNENLLRKGGYINISGTRYHPFDYYAKCLTQAEINPDNWEVLVRCSLKMKDDSRLVPGEFPMEDACILQFPEILSYNELKEKFYQNYESFMCQQQNDPQGGHLPTFDGKLYTSCEIVPERIPLFGGDCYTCWRLPYRDKAELEGAAARVIDGKVYLTNCWKGHYNPSRIAERMVAEHKRVDADAMMILATPGSDRMAAEIRNEAARKNVSVRIHWTNWEEDDDARAASIKQMEPLMKVGRLMFSTTMSKGEECRRQFVHYGLVEENGIIECASNLADLVPLSQLRANMQEQELEWQSQQRDNAMINSFLEQQGMPSVDEDLKRQTTAHLEAMSKAVHWMPPLPGGLDG